jgi:hypothetical protein
MGQYPKPSSENTIGYQLASIDTKQADLNEAYAI